jgi:hypothetical protein
MKLLKRSAGAIARAIVRAIALTNQDFNTTIQQDVFIPAKDRAEISLWVKWECVPVSPSGGEIPGDPEADFRDALGDAIGFVALDEANRIRVDLPKPSLQVSHSIAPAEQGQHIRSASRLSHVDQTRGSLPAERHHPEPGFGERTGRIPRRDEQSWN